MNRYAKILLVILIGVFLAGCASFGEKSDKENWYGLMGSREYFKHETNMLALKKLENSTPDSNPKQGYEGKVQNFNLHKTYNFVIRGPEIKSFLIGPGGIKKERLIPGDYTGTVYDGGNIIGKPWPFFVGVQKHNYLGEEVHWYLYSK
ncbi:hypothetical protein COV49_04125 [Candidatus Falkowbacteria bacterium CG11_big_fil_rev_8_21_14_0_20_39_10]|uniref:Lipoprotein n=1 Tax=Candidatus Falkowbacteria bacterium CG11_big_fil_rev_8_21_14_0_20_39_10 TaxID=1974570 RepID=A0A2M6K7Y3_9BACT|nr:MAG: hypothetical protein COV49_04125 [Candidatus Falkowbacteria bacterium CG11_big_fil_rev_8_21_14_0_20_39_10]